MLKKKSSLEPELSSFAKHLLAEELGLSKIENKVKPKQVSMAIFDPFESGDDEHPTLAKSILNVMNGPGGKSSIERLAFETDPSRQHTYEGIYKQKQRLLPDVILKRLQIQDDLVAAIINTRANQVSTFGRTRPDRFSIGYAIEPKDPGLWKRLDKAEAEEIKKAIARAELKLLHCGRQQGWSDDQRITFAQYLFSSTKNAVGLGRIATEIIWALNAETGKEEFHSFRPTDVGTIYKAAPQATAAQQVRQQARQMLEQIKGERLVPERFENDEYAWVQVIEGRPVQAFTAREMVCHNFYPVNDIELDGYPVTPLDTVIAAVTTHINITTHNKVYFQSGRASHGMLIIESDDVDDAVIAQIKQQFNASINGANNAFRMPVFGVGTGEKISWQAIDSGSRDMEFQYLSDTNARVIMSAFQLSPEELPGWAHLSRGTASQSLSEGNKEYILEAHRDVGIRPLLAQWQDFLNATIFPLIDDKLARICELKLIGLDAESAEKEAIRLQQDSALHYTYDEILHKVEKQEIGKEWGGELPFNPTYKSYLDQYFTVGQILEKFCGVQGASQDQTLAYRRDPFFFQWVQLQQQVQTAQQRAAQPQPDQSQSQSQGQSSDQQPQDGSQESDNQKASQGASDDMGKAIDQAKASLGKSEAQLSPDQKKLVARQKVVVDSFLKTWEEASKEAIQEIAGIAMEHEPKDK